jgi:hypothetical protein
MMLRKRYDERKKGRQPRPDRPESTRALMRGQGTTSKPTSWIGRTRGTRNSMSCRLRRRRQGSWQSLRSFNPHRERDQLYEALGNPEYLHCIWGMSLRMSLREWTLGLLMRAHTGQARDTRKGSYTKPARAQWRRWWWAILPMYLRATTPEWWRWGHSFCAKLAWWCHDTACTKDTTHRRPEESRGSKLTILSMIRRASWLSRMDHRRQKR